jgi:integrase
MANSAKTPTGKARKGSVAIRPDSGSIKACFPRSYCGDGKQIKLATGIDPDNWEGTASKLQRRLQLELEEGKLDDGNGNFNLGRYQEILEEYGLRAKLRIVKNQTTCLINETPPKPQLSILETWDIYCEFRKPSLRESVYQKDYQGRYKKFIQSAIEATNSEDALKIRNWLIENRSTVTVKLVLSFLDKAYQLAIKQKLLSHNPFNGITDDIQTKGAKGKLQNEIETDNDLLDKSKAYTWDEVQVILEAFEKFPHWYNFYKFKFLTGCRTGEAIAFFWGDVEWDKERILVRRNYDRYTKKFYPLKNDKHEGELVRRFPMPKDGELWKLLRSIQSENSKDNDVVFKTLHGKVIDAAVSHVAWHGRTGINTRKGVVAELVAQGKLSKYLPPYNTRHTFITHAIFDLGIDEKVVSKWCGHQLDISNKHYQDVAIFAEKINPEQKVVSPQDADIEALKEIIRQQQEMINRLMSDK